MSKYDYFIKCLVVGDTFVGKTSLCNKLTNSEAADEVYDPTIGVELYYTYKNINWNDWKIHIWDTSGYAGFSKILEEYYKTCAVGVLVFDIKDLKSFHNINYKIDKIKSINPKIFMVVLGNKNDLRNKNDYTEDYYKKFFKQSDIPYYDISVRDNVGLSGLLESIIRRFSKKINLSIVTSKINGTTNIIGLKTPVKCVGDENLVRECMINVDKFCTLI